MQKHVSDRLEGVLQPIAKANGLPNSHYTSQAMFAQERQAVLFDTWSGIGFGKDVPEPGDAKPVDLAGMPLLIVRGQDGNVRVFQNTCRHRGMILVGEPKNFRGVIRCPYHSWCYDLDGALRATPHVGGPGQNKHPDFDRDALGLTEVRSHVWMDVVFVNVSGTATTFETYAGALLERWKEFDRPLFHGGPASSFKLDVKCNWKLAVENYCESYHLPWVHPGLNSYSRLEDHYHIEQPDQFSGQGTYVYRQLKGENDAIFPDFDGLSAHWDAGAEYIAFYPNVLFGVHRDHAYAILLEPLGVDETREHVEIYYPQDISGDPSWQALMERNADQWKGVFEEDIYVVEGMQRGRQGLLFDGGRFSPAMDGPTHAFHQWVARRVSGQARA